MAKFWSPDFAENPNIHGSACKCGGTMGLSKYNYYETYRELQYQCDRCNRNSQYTCGYKPIKDDA